jgi:hypothetical protein
MDLMKCRACIFRATLETQIPLESMTFSRVGNPWGYHLNNPFIYSWRVFHLWVCLLLASKLGLRVSNFKECIRHSRIEKEISLLHVGGMVSATKLSWVVVGLCNKTFYVVVFQTKERHGVVFEISMFLNSCGNVLVMALRSVPAERTKKIKEDNGYKGSYFGVSVSNFLLFLCHFTLFSSIISVNASYCINLILDQFYC